MQKSYPHRQIFETIEFAARRYCFQILHVYRSCSQNTLWIACSLFRSPKSPKRNSCRSNSLLTGVRTMLVSRTGFVYRAGASLFPSVAFSQRWACVCDEDDIFFQGKRPYVIIVHAYKFDALTPLSLLFSSLVFQRTAHSQYSTWMRSYVCVCSSEQLTW